MSRPRVRRTVALMPRFSKIALKESIDARFDPLYGASVGL